MPGDRRPFIALFLALLVVMLPAVVSSRWGLVGFASLFVAYPLAIYIGMPCYLYFRRMGWLRLRPESCAFIARQFESEWPRWYGPGRCRAGVGARLLSTPLAEARRLGFHTIYCATASAVSLLEREAWSRIDEVEQDSPLEGLETRRRLSILRRSTGRQR